MDRVPATRGNGRFVSMRCASQTCKRVSTRGLGNDTLLMAG